MTSEATEATALASISRTFLMQEALRARFRTAEPPPPGSELAHADAVWPHLPYTEHARQALASAWDHFNVVRLVIDARRVFPTGVNGVLRGALVASSLALWLLGPDDHAVRVQRGLAVTEEWYRRRIKFQQDYAASHGEDAAHNAQLEYLQSHRQQASLLRTAATKVQATDIVDWSAAHLWGARSSQRSDTLLQWQRLGGDAHALGWQLLVQDVEWSEGEAGPVQALITGSLANVASPYLCAWTMFDAAILRFDKLRETTHP